eukprot:scaffold15311_cov136-Cylindrotheca_fusiformis.AAC.1
MGRIVFRITALLEATLVPGWFVDPFPLIQASEIESRLLDMKGRNICQFLVEGQPNELVEWMPKAIRQQQSPNHGAEDSFHR